MSATIHKPTELEATIQAIITTHQEQIAKQQEQIKRLTHLLDLQRQYHANLQAAIDLPKHAHNLTLDRPGEIGTYLKLELSQLAARLNVNPTTKLSAASKNKAVWLKLMEQYPDPDGYQWQYPGFRVGFYHQPDLEIIGTKVIDLEFHFTSLN